MRGGGERATSGIPLWTANMASVHHMLLFEVVMHGVHKGVADVCCDSA